MPISVGAGLAIAGGVGAAGSLVSGFLNSGASQSAASTQAAADTAAAQAALQEYQTTNNNLSPYRSAGGAAVQQLENILGLGGTPATTTTTPGTTTTSPSAGGSGSSSVLPNGYSWNAGTGNSADSGMPDVPYITDQNGNIIGTLPNGTTADGAVAALAAQGITLPGTSSTTTTPSTTTTTPGVSAQQAQQNALSSYGLTGLTYQGPTQFNPVGGTIFSPTQASLEATPGYQFDLQQGLQATQNSNAAQGLGVSGAALKGAAAYATGLANNTLTTQAGIFNSNLSNQQTNFQNNYNRGYQTFQSNLGNVLNPLMYLTNTGQNAAATTGQQGISAVANANNLSVGAANATAAGTVGSTNALASGLTGATSSATGALGTNTVLNYLAANGANVGNTSWSTPSGGTAPWLDE